MRRTIREPGRQRAGREGFVTLEIMLGLVLIGFLAALALPGLVRASGPAMLRIAGYQVEAMLRNQRTLAVRTSRPVPVRIDADLHSLMTPNDRVAMPQETRIRLVEGAVPMRFLPDGRSTGGTLALESSRARLFIHVNGETGAIDLAAK
jgi:general secretion pathway protein H